MEITNHPDWLNESFIKQTLEGGDPECNCEVISVKLSPGVSEGNNYCSITYRVNVEYTKSQVVHKKSLFIKSPLVEGNLRGLIEEAKFAENEILMYTKYFPFVSKIVGTKRISPISFTSPIHELLVMEDLCAQGYVMCDKFRQLDFSHCAVALKSLAEYHASSIVAHRQNPELVELELGEKMLFIENSKMTFELMKQKLQTFVNSVSKWGKFQDLCALINSKLDKVIDLILQTVHRKSKINVLNHGDFWTNNILFRYDQEGNVCEAKMIDFQIAMYGSYAIDLQYFTWSSINACVCKQRLDELYFIYLDTLNNSLESYGAEERITFGDFNIEMESMLLYGLFTISFPVTIMFSKSELDVYNRPCYREAAEEVLKRLQNHKIFENL